jgi:hypothetical protein
MVDSSTLGRCRPLRNWSLRPATLALLLMISGAAMGSTSMKDAIFKALEQGNMANIDVVEKQWLSYYLAARRAER